MIFVRGLVLLLTNETTFKIAGLSDPLSVTGTIMMAHAISGVMAALGGILLASWVGAAYALSGTGYPDRGSAED